MYIENPILKNKVSFLNYILIWVLVILTHIVILSAFYKISLPVSITDSLLFNIVFSVLGIMAWFPVKFIKTETGKRFLLLFNHLLIALIISGIWISLGYAILSQLYQQDLNYLEFLKASLPWRFFSGIMYYAGISLFYYALLFYYSLQEKIRRESELKSKVREAEMNMLKFQLNPHFLFNSLNSISSLTMGSPEKAREMIIQLSDFLRYSLQQDGMQKSSLESELANIENYLTIEKIRFGEKLEFVKKIDEACLSCNIPSLILQPLFENAIKHGVYQSTGKVKIEIGCKQEGGMLVIWVKNNFDSETGIKKGAGIGLKNIAERLNLIYNANKLLEIKQETDRFTVFMHIPVDK